MQKISVNRRETKFSSDPSRIIIKFYFPGNKRRIKSIINRVLKLSEENVTNLLHEILYNFAHRHRKLEEVFKMLKY
jgi:transcriptional regulator with GAF, ATPase, and Fis domain